MPPSGRVLQVLESVRLPLLSPYFLHDCVSKQKIVRTSPECQTLLEEARYVIGCPGLVSHVAGPA